MNYELRISDRPASRIKKMKISMLSSYERKGKAMEGATETNVIEKMLETEKNACLVLDEAMEKSNKMVLQAREEARELIQKTKENLQREQESLQKRLLSEGEKEATRIMAEKEKYLKELKKRAIQRRILALEELRNIVMEDL